MLPKPMHFGFMRHRHHLQTALYQLSTSLDFGLVGPAQPRKSLGPVSTAKRGRPSRENVSQGGLKKRCVNS